MQTKLFFYTLPAILLMAGSGLQAQSAENQLPLKISTKEQLHSTTQNGSAEFAITAENVFTFRKTAITTNTGDAEAIIRFTDVPGILTIQANSVKDQVCSFKEGDHNHVLISESADGITYTKETKYQANTSHDLTLSLEKTTRYVKFRYIVARNRAVILGWGSYCSHGFNPFSFQLPKTVDILPEDIQAEGFIGEVITKTISVGYSNPLGNLEIISSNPDFSIKKLTEQPEASASGISEYEVSFTATTAGQESTVIRVADSAYPEAAEEITMNAVVFDLKAPETLVVEAITLTSADLSWTPAEKAISYQVIVLDENKDVVSETNTDQTTHTCTELIPGKTYFIGIRSVGENGKLSVLSELQEITTHSLTAPGNIIAEQARTQLTFSWQAVAYAQEYQVTLTDKDNTIISEEVIPATQSSHTFANLKRGESYIFRIVSLAETESSAIAELATATLNDFGAQLENSGFENWESVDKGSEPLNWNSFGTVGG
ncbi:MAG: fibronectin type III domain-containing protein, partial [Bacteroidales bacterium]